jgi:uncharacterized protein
VNATNLIAARAGDAVAAGLFDAKSDGTVPSPCISLCRMAADGGHCLGCFRTLGEIGAWSGAGPAQRRAIWAALLQRAGLPVPEALAAAPAASRPPR